MELWLRQMQEKMAVHVASLEQSLTAENAVKVEGEIYYQKAQQSCMKWLIGLARQAGDRREQTRLAKQAAESPSPEAPAKKRKR